MVWTFLAQLRGQLKPDLSVTYLAAQLEVDHDYRDLRARDHEDAENEKQKSEEIIELILPQRGQDEEELDEYRAERQDTGHQGAAKQEGFVPSAPSTPKAEYIKVSGRLQLTTIPDSCTTIGRGLVSGSDSF